MAAQGELERQDLLRQALEAAESGLESKLRRIRIVSRPRGAGQTANAALRPGHRPAPFAYQTQIKRKQRENELKAVLVTDLSDAGAGRETAAARWAARRGRVVGPRWLQV
jgi:hypothetical protein